MNGLPRWLAFAVVALLAMIWLEVGGADSVRSGWRWLRDALTPSGEAPAPPSSTGGINWDGTEALRALLSMPPASTP
jgi:hypothetical protein